MKAHIEADAESGLVHTVRGTAANVNDVVEANSLPHGDEVDAWGCWLPEPALNFVCAAWHDQRGRWPICLYPPEVAERAESLLRIG